MISRSCTKCGRIKPLSDFHHAKLGLYGHAAWCKLCDAARRKKYDTANREKVTAQQQKWAENNRDKACEKSRRWRERHPEALAALEASYRKRNPEKRAFWQMMRQARKLQAMPDWADQSAIQAIYLNCPPGYHVDHIIPLVGMRGRAHVASGLHIPANLQYLPAQENRRKWATLPE